MAENYDSIQVLSFKKKKKIKDAVFRSTITDDLNDSLVTPLISTSLISSTIHMPQANNYIDSKSNLVRKAKGDQRVVCGTNTNNKCQQAFLCRKHILCCSYRTQWPGLRVLTLNLYI